MTMVLLFLILAVAFANGANDVSKGVGTLVGSRLATYRQGLTWGTIWTIAGGLVSISVPAGLVHTFSTGLLRASPTDLNRFLLAVSAGVFGWVMLASRRGLPVSTTHAITGAILGVAIIMDGIVGVRWPELFLTVFVPLALSPFLAGSIAYALQAISAGRLSIARRYCLCVEDRSIAIVPVTPTVLAATAQYSPASTIVVGETADCKGDAIVSRIRIIDAAHWITSAGVSFTRGLNDNPKIIALGVGAAAATGIGVSGIFVASALAMGAGSFLCGRRVTNTLAEKVTDIDPVEGLSASFVTSVLVLLASFAALPVSTTHVSAGAIVGAGLWGGKRAVRWQTVNAAAVAWLVTLPCAAIIGAIAWSALEWALR